MANSASPPQAPVKAVVFAYHSVGVRCLKVLLARGVQVELVVTHQDNPAENHLVLNRLPTCATSTAFQPLRPPTQNRRT